MKLLIALLFGCAAGFGQTVSLSFAGMTQAQITLNVNLSGSAGQNIAGIEFTLPVPVGSSITTTSGGPASVGIAKGLSCAAGTVVTCLTSGLNTNTYSDGLVASLSISLPAVISTSPWTMPVVVASAAGGSVSVTVQTPQNLCQQLRSYRKTHSWIASLPITNAQKGQACKVGS